MQRLAGLMVPFSWSYPVWSGLERVFYLWLWLLGCDQQPFSCAQAFFGKRTNNQVILEQACPWPVRRQSFAMIMIKNFFGLSRNFWAYPETFWSIWTLWSLSENCFSPFGKSWAHPETFKILHKLLSLSGNIPDYLATWPWDPKGRRHGTSRGRALKSWQDFIVLFCCLCWKWWWWWQGL